MFSTYTQIKLGHGYFKLYLERLPAYDTNLCNVCKVKQTPEHILLNCRIYKAEQKTLKNAVLQSKPQLPAFTLSTRLNESINLISEAHYVWPASTPSTRQLPAYILSTRLNESINLISEAHYMWPASTLSTRQPPAYTLSTRLNESINLISEAHYVWSAL